MLVSIINPHALRCLFRLGPTKTPAYFPGACLIDSPPGLDCTIAVAIFCAGTPPHSLPGYPAQFPAGFTFARPYNKGMRRCFFFLLLCFVVVTGVRADDAAFDLIGPKVDVRVKRGEHTLPIAQVPNLMPGDRLWIHPDFPESQSAHFVLIVGFLRGATNPPPNDWFTRIETWVQGVRQEGVFVTIPKDAEQAILFLAPETGGDFNTLRKTVHDRPGSFVRATQDLQIASWERLRLEAYMAQVKTISETQPKALKEHTELSARSLGIKVNEDCFSKSADQQLSCLMQHTEGMVLDDSNVQSAVSQFASGNTADLMNQISSSSIGHGGAYSAYIGAIVDTAKIMASLHTAHFQYIPALALSTADTLNLRLNTAPSFRDPKSVVVIALPPIGPAKPPALHPVSPKDSYCAQKPSLVLPADGAPLAYATPMASNLKLVVDTKTGKLEVPAKLDAAQGGIALDHVMPLENEAEMTGVVRGKWGFDDWEGPRFRLHNSIAGKWAVSADDQSALVVGRDDLLHITDASTLCVDRIERIMPLGNPLKLTWKSPKPEELEVTVPLKEATPGPVSLAIYQFGQEKPDRIELKAYSEAASLEKLTLSAGDATALLKGTRLDEVARAILDGITFTPAGLNRVQDYDQLLLKAESSTSALDPLKRYQAVVELQDGRKLKVKVTVDPARPQVSLLNKGSQNDAFAPPSPVHLGSSDDLSVDGRLVFFLKSLSPVNFPRDQKVEVSAVDNSFRTVLSLTDGSLILEDAKTALGTIDPLARFGPSAFGPLHVRVIGSNGVTGDWIELGTLVRVPSFKELRCSHASPKTCLLSGSNLFLLTAISATQDFENAVDLPAEFTGTTITVPHPVAGALYIKLRDDPNTVQTLTLPINTVNPPPPTSLLNPSGAVPPPAPATAQNPSAKTDDPAAQLVPAMPPPANAQPANPTPATTAAPAKTQ